MTIELDADDAKLATQACEHWAGEIMDTLTGAKSISYSAIARQDMTETANKLRRLALRFAAVHED